MNKSEKILIITIIIVSIVSIGITYYKTIIKNNFEAVNIEPALDDTSVE